MNTLHLTIVDSPDKAPSYRGGDFRAATLAKAVIVSKGIESGKPTVDLVFEIKDENGKTVDIAVAMTTGKIIKMLASAIEGAEGRNLVFGPDTPKCGKCGRVIMAGELAAGKCFCGGSLP